MSIPVFMVSYLSFSKIKGRNCGTINRYDELLLIQALMKNARETLVH